MNCANAGKEKQQKELLEEKNCAQALSLDLTLLIAAAPWFIPSLRRCFLQTVCAASKREFVSSQIA